MNSYFNLEKLQDLIKKLQERFKQNDNSNSCSEEFSKQMESFFYDFSNLKYALDASVIVGATNVQGDIIFVNEKFCEISKYSREELIGKNHRILKSDQHDQTFFRNMWKTIGRGEIWEGEVKNLAKDGSFYWVKTTIVPIKNTSGKPIMYISFRTDITEGKLAQEKLFQALRNDFRVVVNSMDNLIFKVRKNEEQVFFYVLIEGKLARQLNLDGEKMVSKGPKDVFSVELGQFLEEKYAEAFVGQPVTYTFSYGGRVLLTHLSPVCENDTVTEIIGVINDITELYQAQKEIKYMAYHDMLTSLPNRTQFKEDVTKLIENSQGHKGHAVFLLDLDRFQHVNDALGHTVGDLLIKSISSRLEQFTTAKGTVYKFAGDEFIILFPNVSHVDDVTKLAEEVLATFENNFSLTDTLEIHATASIGISIYPEHGTDDESLLRNADTAMFVAKDKGKSTFQIYAPAMNQHQEETLLIEQHLHDAIRKKEFELYFQPKLDLASGKVTGMEALLRWKSPVLGSVSPEKFIKAAEDTGFIIKVDQWVLEEACRQCQLWNRVDPLNPLRVSVNISPILFYMPNFVDMIKSAIEKTKLSPHLLEIEITESCLISNVDETITALRKLKELGVSVAIDDFGKGYSSLNYLTKLPITTLKIDKAFIDEMPKNKETLAIVKAIILLSHELNLKVVAEGIESKEVFVLLKGLGCNEVQGYYVSKPLPQQEFEKLITEINRPPLKSLADLVAE